MRACAGEGTTTWSVQYICCVRRSSLVALLWLSRKYFFLSACRVKIRRLCRGGRPRGSPLSPDRAVDAPDCCSCGVFIVNHWRCGRDRRSFLLHVLSIGEHFLGGDLAMAPGCHCQQLLTRAGFAHSHGAPARRAPSYGTGLPLPAAADTGRLCPLARRPGKAGA